MAQHRAYRPQHGNVLVGPLRAGQEQYLRTVTFFVTPDQLGGLDLSARPPLPADALAFTVTRPMYERLCRLDEASFLFKPYWTDLQALRARQRRSEP